VTVAVIAGLVTGLGVWLAWSGLRPMPEPLGAALARVDRRPTDLAPLPAAARGLDERDMRIGRFLLRRVRPLAQAIDLTHADLRIIGRTAEEQALRVVLLTILALVIGPWFGFITWAVGLNLPSFMTGCATLGGMGWGLVAPFIALRRDARSRRQAFGHALSAWCDVVVMSLASGRGVEQAMETAASAGKGWAFTELRSALHAGYVRGEPPWVALGHLGAELGIPDLTELSSTIAMAGEEGAAVRVTVAAKARTIRERITAETELTEAAVTERMSLPSILLVLGFLIFLGYPAVHAMFQIGR
jgi:tight adherence protein C